MKAMNQSFNFINQLKDRVAMMAIGRSTLRSQGAPGMVGCAREFLRRLDLRAFSKISAAAFDTWLDRQTLKLSRSFPGDGKGNWGAARKSLNIFLRDVLYCRPLCTHFGLGHLEPALEVPLDSNVYAGLASDTGGQESLPPWSGVKNLTPKISRDLQARAAAIAHSLGVSRVHLDVRYWRKAPLAALSRS